jgi:TolB-like protein/DNA-binding winged helix-turn-helix (wHTH) protein/Tfp pilus assembly protein PilF
MRTFWLDELIVDPSSGTVQGLDRTEHLEPKIMMVLVTLAERAHRVVTRDELLEQVWPGVAVTNDAVSRTIYQLRRQLERAGSDPRYRALIETLPKRGYRLSASIRQPDGLDSTFTHPAPIEVRSSPPSRGLARWAAAGALVAAVTLTIAWFAGHAALNREPVVDATAARVHTGERASVATIVVLPFQDLRDAHGMNFFAEGLADEIRTLLANWTDLRVIGRTSSDAFRNHPLDFAALTRQLGATHVLEGAYQRDGNRLRVSAQLLDGAGVQVWAARFDRDLHDVFDIQSKIADAVARTVASHVTANAFPTKPVDLAAYDEYLAGRDLVHRREYSAAQSALRSAVAIEPEFAAAHAELAVSLLMGWVSKDQLREADTEIARALALKPDLLRAQAARGLRLLNSTPADLAESERVLRRALDKDPNMSDALLWLSTAVGRQHRFDEAYAILERAIRIDPLHPSIAVNLARELQQRGEPGRARQLLETRIQQTSGPGSLYLYIGLRDLYRNSGDLASLNALTRSQVMQPNFLTYYDIATSYALFSDWQMAERLLLRSVREFPDARFVRFSGAVLPAWRGDFRTAAQRFRALAQESGFDLSREDDSYGAWLGALLARAGEFDQAIAVLEPLLESGQVQVFDPVGGDTNLYAPHALAWAYRLAGADVRADRLLGDLDQRCSDREHLNRLNASIDLYLCAETAMLQGDDDIALGRLEQAIAAGWREVYLKQRDPLWARMTDHPRYRALLSEARKDVDRQRAAIAVDHPADEFLARIDALPMHAGPLGD